jgi:hypothetical protein
MATVLTPTPTKGLRISEALFLHQEGDGVVEDRFRIPRNQISCEKFNET